MSLLTAIKSRLGLRAFKKAMHREMDFAWRQAEYQWAIEREMIETGKYLSGQRIAEIIAEVDERLGPINEDEAQP